MATVTFDKNKTQWRGIRLAQGEDFFPVGPPFLATAVEPGAQVTVNTTGVTVLASDADRLWALIKNMTATIAYIKLGATPATTNFELQEDEWIRIAGYTGIITGITAAGSTTVSVVAL